MIGTPQTTEDFASVIVYKQNNDDVFVGYEFWVEQHIPGRPRGPRSLFVDADHHGIRTVEGAATLATKLAREEAQR